MKRQAKLQTGLAPAPALELCQLVLRARDWDIFDVRVEGFSAGESLVRLCCTMSPARLEIAAGNGGGGTELTVAGSLVGPGSRRIEQLVDGVAARIEVALDGAASGR